MEDALCGVICAMQSSDKIQVSVSLVSKNKKIEVMCWCKRGKNHQYFSQCFIYIEIPYQLPTPLTLPAPSPESLCWSPCFAQVSDVFPASLLAATCHLIYASFFIGLQKKSNTLKLEQYPNTDFSALLRSGKFSIHWHTAYRRLPRPISTSAGLDWLENRAIVGHVCLVSVVLFFLCFAFLECSVYLGKTTCLFNAEWLSLLTWSWRILHQVSQTFFRIMELFLRG